MHVIVVVVHVGRSGKMTEIVERDAIRSSN